ncbi:PHB depolymerase family esterase [Sulfitobacter sp. S190]|uniref:extracellular catalytic domain type 1 short-chain-length polyhydroxyalkanoate depolymerase n=1 Tax=Sulfitobacter sp. S190 TaxID=2867022 RepID=UPI0021A8A5D2|nr:PHB depolymerase family esterase [Sulfitobacter sp. S190]UWR21241.1 PHB depolymerase family esterase [Sulfitobacter sp. S190]
MKFFNVGAMGPAFDAARLSNANSLVERTLSQHGLWPADDGLQRSKPLGDQAPMDPMAQFGSKLKAPRNNRSQHRKTYTCRAGSREYLIYVPEVASEQASGVVMMLHGCTQSPEDFAAGTGMNALADLHGFVVVYPVQARGNNAQSCWNWFSVADQRRGAGEPAILAGLAAEVAADHKVDRANTFVAGLSAGAAMAAILGETYPDVFAAVGAHSGLPKGAARDVPSAFGAMSGKILDAALPSKSGSTVRTIAFHGTRDSTVHPENSERIFRRATNIRGSSGNATTELGTQNGRSYERCIVWGDDGVPTAELWRVEGQGHAWSGGDKSGSYTDDQGPDASREMVRFFFNCVEGV